MKVKVTEKILDFDGTPLKENDIKLSRQLVSQFEQLVMTGKILAPMQIVESLKKELDKDPLTLRTVFHQALNSIVTEPDGKAEILSATDKAKAYEITKKVFASKEPDFTEDQVEYILKRVEKVYLQPIICGKVKEAFTKK